MLAVQEIVQRIEKKFPDAIVDRNLEAIDPWIVVAADSLVDLCLHLRDDRGLRFNFLQCISGVDFLTGSEPPHFEVVYHLLSLVYKHRLVVKVRLPRWKNDQPGELPEIPSVASVWATANWHEREVFDLSGVRFVGHPDLRRILCADGWIGHPLRKDYQAPTEFEGISFQ